MADSLAMTFYHALKADPIGYVNVEVERKRSVMKLVGVVMMHSVDERSADVHSVPRLNVAPSQLLVVHSNISCTRNLCPSRFTRLM